MIRKLASVFAAIVPLVACSAATEGPTPQPSETDEVSEGAESLSSANSTYYIVTRQDLRKCMYPLCGGYFVKRVNRVLTRCADGSWQKDCHMVDLDLSALGVGDQQASDYVNGVFGPGLGLVRGKLVKNGMADTLVASEAWVGAAGTQPTGDFYRVTDSGILCITYPCPSIHEAKLNSSLERNVHDVDLYASGAKMDLVFDGYSAIYGKGALVAGDHAKIKGPAGSGKQLVASEFYLPLEVGTPHCGTIEVATPGTTTFYAKNFDSEQFAWDWLSANFPYGQNANVFPGACDQPKACIKIYAPVCGVVKDSDPSTYGNWCSFEAAVLADAGPTGESKGFYSEGECGTTKCDYSDPNKTYVAQSPEQCQVVKFACQPGEQPFFDDCGCGCEVAKGEPCGPNTCAAGQVCCNASCGICTDPGMFCTQQACE